MLNFHLNDQLSRIRHCKESNPVFSPKKFLKSELFEMRKLRQNNSWQSCAAAAAADAARAAEAARLKKSVI